MCMAVSLILTERGVSLALPSGDRSVVQILFHKAICQFSFAYVFHEWHFWVFVRYSLSQSD